MVFAGTNLFAFDVYDDLANAIRSGDAKQLSAFFGTTIDLTVIDRENVYSKAQAELILKDFFVKNPPKSFTIIHKGSSPEGIQYAIGSLATPEKNYRISFYVKNTGGKLELKEFRIENE